MGERGNIELIYPDGNSVWFYTHWRGYKLSEIVAMGLHRGAGRWNDPDYLARIIFCELVPVDEHYSETGFGISTAQGDYNYPDVTVNFSIQKVVGQDRLTYTYQEFIDTHLAKSETNQTTLFDLNL